MQTNPEDNTIRYDGCDIVVTTDFTGTDPVKLYISQDGDGEGIWMELPSHLIPLWEKNGCSEVGYGKLVNHSLHGFPWGTIVPFRFKGENRPEFIVEKLTNRAMIFHDDTRAEYPIPMLYDRSEESTQ